MTSPAPRILVVDDEPQIRRFLRTTLSAHGYRVIEASCGRDALGLTATEQPALVLLDLGLPDIDGLEVIHRLREWSTVPIIVVSVRGQESEKIAALDHGADDYVTKPFGMGELLARMRAALRHRLQAELDEPVFHAGGLTVDLGKRVVSVDSHEVKLTPKEYDLLRVMVTHAGKVITTNTYYARCGDPVRCTKHTICGCTSGSSARSSNPIRRSPVTSSPSRGWATACGWRTRGRSEVQS